MATQDISRHLLQPTKHYSTVHMQQGRVIVDSDWNERANIENEDLRTSLLDIMCAKGTPNDGMLVTNPAAVGGGVPLPVGGPAPSYDFDIGAGSYYLGGRRLAVDGDAETLLTQRDWLQIDVDDNQLPPEVTSGSRIDLVFIYSWDQPVTAVEDRELREVALGGRDTSTRVKRVRRVQVHPNVSDTDCAAAFGDFKTDLLAASSPATFDDDTCELISAGLLEVGLVSSDEEEDLCAEPTATGYVAAHNQAIRVELREGHKLVWGYDNASKLYRVTIAEDKQTLTFLNEPEDLPSMPRAGQAVELMIWGAKLPNSEKVAELQGAITTVDTSYDPTTKTIVIADTISDDWVNWLELHVEHHNLDDDADEREFLFLRVWDRGPELVDVQHPAEITYTKGVAFDLGDSGLSLTVWEHGVAGDYWIIAARPETPDVVTPWDLTTSGGVPPHGPRRFFAPIATINWTDDGATVAVSDCRTKLRQLCEGGCCTVTVGDGERSFGQVSSLSDAIELVPNGGTICLLPGRHAANAVLLERNDIIIEGCGPETVLVSPAPSSSDPATGDPEQFYAPVLTIKDSSRVQVRKLRVEAHSCVGISIERSDTKTCDDVLLDNLEVFASGAVSGDNDIYEYAAPCVGVLAATGVDIRNSTLEQDAVASISAAVVLAGSRLRLLDCHVKAPVYDGVEVGALGGVNIRSGSYDVDVIGCVIEGGWGNGIAIGSIAKFPRDNPSEQLLWDILSKLWGIGIEWILPNGNTDCVEPEPNGSKTASEGTTDVWLPLGPVEKVRIHDNVIRSMGLSGISTIEFFDSTFDWDDGNTGPVFIVAADFDICRNTIENNVMFTDLPETLASKNDRCVGGVCLAAAINPVIRENVIARNGTENVRVPACGVGLIAAQNVTIEDNRIVDNGVQLSANDEPVARGLRGGIVIVEATPVRGFTFPQSDSGPTLPSPTTDYTGASGGSAVVVRGNEVSQPIGRALWIQRAHGAVTVTGNTLESFGNPVFSTGRPLFNLCWTNGTSNVTRGFEGACVEIFGYSKALDVDWSDPDMVDAIPPPSWVDSVSADPLEDGGNTMVSQNVIRLSWDVIGGLSTAVLISTLASAVFDNNDVSVNMFSQYVHTPPPAATMDIFYSDIMADSHEHSWVMSSVYVAGYSTSQANGNRVMEGQFDALFSLTTGTVVRPGSFDIIDLQHGVSATANVLSHAVVTLDPATILSAGALTAANGVLHEADTTPDGYGVMKTSVVGNGLGRRICITDYASG